MQKLREVWCKFSESTLIGQCAWHRNYSARKENPFSTSHLIDPKPGKLRRRLCDDSQLQRLGLPQRCPADAQYCGTRASNGEQLRATASHCEPLRTAAPHSRSYQLRLSSFILKPYSAKRALSRKTPIALKKRCPGIGKYPQRFATLKFCTRILSLIKRHI